MVEAEHVLVTEVLHLHHLRAVLGISMGGMQTFQWIVAYPTFMDKAIPIMGSPRLTSYDLLLWTAQERAIEEDPAWNGGAYREPPAAGMRTAADILALNLYTPAYRVEHTTPSEFPQFLAKTEDDTLKLFDANNWIRQLQAMMAQDVAKPFRGSMEQAATAVRAEVMIIVGTQDHIVNPDPATAFGNLLKARVMRLESDCGHLSIFCQEEMMSAETTKFLAP
jgi:homoserine O-acetyltransferase